MTERLSNTALGELLGVSHATVSRIRSGDRNPGLDVMIQIAKLTGWSIDDQVKARDLDAYPTCFEEAFEGYDPKAVAVTS
jgi:transcriptional regulator with XRE-family HTH domain